MSKKIMGRISHEKGFIKVEVPVVFFEDDGIYYAHIPPLDITGYGNNEKEARHSLTVMVDEFINYTTENNTLNSELERLGWVKQPEIHYPPISDLIPKNDQLKDAIDNKTPRIERIDIEMPVLI